MKTIHAVVMALSVMIFLLSPAITMARTPQVLVEELRSMSERLDSPTQFDYRLNDYGFIHLMYGRLSDNAGAEIQDVSHGFLQRYGSIFGLTNPDTELRLVRSTRDRNGLSHVVYQQQYKGILVQHAYLKLHSDIHGYLAFVSSDIHPGIQISTAPSLSKEDAAQVAQSEFGYSNSRVNIKGLVIFVDDQVPYLTYRLEIGALTNAREYFIDAHSGKVVKTYPLVYYDGPTTGTGVNVLGDTVQNLQIYDGAGFDTQPVQSVIDIWNNNRGYPDYIPVTGPYNLVDVSNPTLGTIYTLSTFDTSWFEVDYVWSDSAIFFSELGAISHRSGVSAHSYHRITLDYFSLRHGRDGWDDAGLRVIGVVDYGGDDISPFNAFYNSYTNTMNYGLGGPVSGGFVYRPFCAGLDVVAHEFTHGVTRHSSNLVYENLSGALNEHMSDAFGYFVEAYGQQGGDWYIGEDLSGNTGYLGLRSMEDPPAGGQPDYVGGQFYFPPTDNPGPSNDNGGVHINSGIPNKVLYLLVEGGTHRGVIIAPFEPVQQDARAVAGNIWYTWNNEYLTAQDDFSTAFVKMMMVSRALYPDNDAYFQSILNAWASVNVHTNINPMMSVTPVYTYQDSTVQIETQLTDPDSLFHHFWAVISSDSTFLDTIQLQDDGLQDDSVPNNGIYGAPWTVENEGTLYRVNFLAKNDSTGLSDLFLDQARFTTQGPVSFDGITFTTDTLLSPGDNVYFQFALSNEGQTGTITGVSAKLVSGDSMLTISNPSGGFGDIPAGEVGTIQGGAYGLNIHESYAVDTTISIRLDIASDGYVFWHDSILFEIERAPVGITSERTDVPDKYALHQNFPNPFNPVTTIRFDLPEPGMVKVLVFDITGKRIARLMEGFREPGFYSVEWNGENDSGNQVSSGVYYYRIDSEDYSDTKKMVLLR